MILSWWHSVLNTVGRKKNKAARGRRVRAPRRFRSWLWLESMEERLAPATSAFYSLPTDLVANRGTVVNVPVSINHLSDAAGNQGLNSADVVLTYDATVFSVADADISQGAILINPPPNGTWTFTANTATPGEIDITLFSSDLAHDITSATGGVLANVNFHVKGAAPVGNSTIHVVVPPATSPNGLSGDALPDSGPNGISGDAAGYTLNTADQVDGVVNVTNIVPTTTLSLPTNQTTTPGSTITVPVNISNPDPSGSSGMIAADAAILYDPNVFSVAASGAVTAGTDVPPTGWTVSYGVDTSGNNTVDATKASLGLHLVNTNNTPSTTTSAGSLWLVTFTVKGTAAGGATALNLVPRAKVGSSFTTTNVTGLNGTYQLSPTPTNASTDAVDGVVGINKAPAITSTGAATFTTGTAGSFTVTATGFPTPSLSETGALPGGVTFTDNGNGTATLTGTPAANSGGTYPLTITASNGIGSDATQSFTLTVDQAAAITSTGSATFMVGAAGTFSVTTTGFPKPALSETGVLPGGVTFTDNGDGTASLSGTPAANNGGSYPITITAHNGIGADATQSFTLTADQASAITSTASATFTVGAAGGFSVTATGFPKPALSETGALPGGVAFTDNGNGTASLSGTPAAGSGGVYVLTVTASNGVGSDATQSFTLTVNQASVIDSSNATTFTTGAAGTFTVTTDNSFPRPALSEVGALPGGISFTDNGNGTATLSGTPAANAGGTFPLTITARNGIGADATQRFTLTVDQASAITSTASTTFTTSTVGTFTVTATGFPTPTLSETGTLPGGVTFTDNGNGTAALSGTPAANSGGTYPLTFTAHNGIGADATQSFTLIVDQAPAITSGNATTFTTGAAGSFSVTATGFPAPTFTETGALPGGVTLTSAGLLGGTPAANSGGTYPITITAHNGVGSDATQSFTLTVDQAPAITSGNATTFTTGAAGSFTVTTTGFPPSTIGETGALPGGVTFTDNGNGTAALTGTPAANSGGTYPITITARNGIGSNATQSFTLTVDQAPAITSGNATTFTVGAAGSFSVTATGFPAPTFTETGALPGGVTLTSAGLLSGTPAAGTGGVYPITITASNGVGSNATQSFTLTVNQASVIDSGNATTFATGAAGTFTVTTDNSFPKPALSETGALPGGVTFTDNGNGTATLTGTPAANSGGTYPITITARNGIGADATQSFTLTIDQAPAITSGNATTFTVGAAGSFSVTATGFPAPTFTETGALPGGVTLTSAGLLSGTPATNSGGTYPITITASNGVGSNATQSFTLTVNQAPAITSGNAATFTTGTAGSFSVTATGFPAPTFTETGALPGGVTLTSAGLLSGTPAANSGGTYPITITASNGVGANATQSFTLTVNQAPAITSGSANTFTVGTAGSFNVTATGFPAPTFTETGALPGGVTLTSTGLLSGTPAAGTGGVYPITITATNGVGADATQSFTLTVNQAAVINSGNTTTFTTGAAGAFTVTTDSSFPKPALSETGALPGGVTFTDNGNGTATLTGTPAANSGGTFPLTITARNGIGADATQSFTVTVNQAPAITSGNATTFSTGAAGSFTVTATGFPAPTFTENGALPGGVTITSAGQLSGTPAANSGATYPITITAHNGSGADATQSFTLTVNQAPAITSGNATGFTVGTAGSFNVTATGFPAPTFTETGALPGGVTLSSAGLLSGTPAPGSAGVYPITITAHNGSGGDATQSFTLTANTSTTSQGPTITSANATTFVVGVAGNFTATATGSPTPTFTETGTLPNGVSLTSGGQLTGTPAFGTQGTYPITLIAHNGAGSDARMAFTLTVLTPQQNFVQAAYRDTLGRAGDLANPLDAGFWVNLLTNNIYTQAQVGKGIVQSFEGRDHEIQGWYQAFLGRPAVNGEELYWVRKLDQGKTEEQALREFFSDSFYHEFFDRAGRLFPQATADASYTQGIYQALLGRAATDAEVASWAKVRAQTGLDGEAFAVLTSNEYRTDLFTFYYNSQLHRAPEAAGLQFWVSSGLDISAVRIGFLASAEFFTNG